MQAEVVSVIGELEPGGRTARHQHPVPVFVYVLEGTLTFFWGSEKKEAVAGSFIYQPRGTPHGLCVEGATPARILYMTIPAGFDRFMLEQKLPNSKSEREMAAARYKIEILGPLPECCGSR